MKRHVLTMIALMMSLAVKAGTVYVGGEYTQATIGRYIVIASADENGVLDYDASLPAKKAVYGSPVYSRWNVGTSLADITPQGFASNVTDVDNRTKTLILPTQSIGLYYRAFSNFANLETIIFKNDDYGFTRALMTYTPGASSPDNGKSVSCVFEGLQNVKKAVFAKEPPQYSTGLIGSQIFTVTESVYFPASCSNQWQKLLRNIGYNGTRVSYEGTWPDITPVCVNGLPVGYMPPPNEVTNVVYTVVTNEVVHYVTNTVKYVDTSYAQGGSVITNIVADIGSLVGTDRGIASDAQFEFVNLGSWGGPSEYDFRLREITYSGEDWVRVPASDHGCATKLLQSSQNGRFLSNAKRIILPSHLDNIDYKDFSGDTNLVSLVFTCDKTVKISNFYSTTPPAAFGGCWNLQSLAFYGPPLELAAYPGQYAKALIDSEITAFCNYIFFTPKYEAQWEKILGNIGYSGNRVCFEGEWPNINVVSVNGRSPNYVEPPTEVTNYVHTIVTNVIHTMSEVTNIVEHFSTVTNVIEHEHHTTVTNVVRYVPEPGTSPAPAYRVEAGSSGSVHVEGANGWDAFNIPDGMTWNREAGTLEGQPTVPGTYDLLLVSGSGTDTKIMRTAIAVADYQTIVGYVGVAFSKSGAPLAQVAKTPSYPAGLKWANNVLSGVPTKAGTYKYTTKDNVPFTIEINALPGDVVGTFDASVYLPPSYVTNGIARTCDILGTLSMTAAESGKLSVSVKTAQKSYSFSIASWTKLENGNLFTLEGKAALKTGEALQVNAYVFAEGDAILLAKLTGGAFGDGCVTVLRKDVYAKSGKTWVDPEAHARMAQCAGTYIFKLTAVEEPEAPTGVSDVSAWTLSPVAKAGASFVKVVVKDTGAVTITGAIPNKTKLNFSAKATATASGDKIVLGIESAGFSGKTITLPLSIEINSDGSIVEVADNCGVVYYEKR